MAAVAGRIPNGAARSEISNVDLAMLHLVKP
jgi:hypothetical protein